MTLEGLCAPIKDLARGAKEFSVIQDARRKNDNQEQHSLRVARVTLEDSHDVKYGGAARVSIVGSKQVKNI